MAAAITPDQSYGTSQMKYQIILSFKENKVSEDGSRLDLLKLSKFLTVVNILPAQEKLTLSDDIYQISVCLDKGCGKILNYKLGDQVVIDAWSICLAHSQQNAHIVEVRFVVERLTVMRHRIGELSQS